MHDFHRNTAEALPELIRQLKAGGYKVVHMVPKAELNTVPKYDEMVRHWLGYTNGSYSPMVRTTLLSGRVLLDESLCVQWLTTAVRSKSGELAKTQSAVNKRSPLSDKDLSNGSQGLCGAILEPLWNLPLRISNGPAPALPKTLVLTVR